MVKHKYKSIKDKGGLKSHMQEMGYSYRIFKLLVLAKTSDTATANILTAEKRMRTGVKDQDKVLSRKTTKHWKEVYREEQKELKLQHEADIESLKHI